MNIALVKLVRKYEDRAVIVAAKSQTAAEFYRNAAKQVLALARQQ